MDIKDYIVQQRKLLKQFGIWKKIPFLEKKEFLGCTSEIQVDNYVIMFRRKYL